MLDSNVVVSAFLERPSSTLGTIVDMWRGRRFELVMSVHIAEEVRRTWTRKRYFRERLSVDEVDSVFDLLRQRATWVDPSNHVQQTVLDAGDSLVLATAIAGDADYLVTGDAALLALGEHAGVRVVTAVEFVRVLMEVV